MNATIHHAAEEVVGDAHHSANAQDRTHNDRGKVLRMTRTGRVPSRNPFGNRIFSYGLRNSFGFAFDPRTGRLWESENGPECNDELNRIVAGGNFAWGPHETCAGQAPGDTNRDGPAPRILPLAFFPDTIAPTGATFCTRQCGLGAALDGRLIYGDWKNGDIHAVTLTSDRLDIASQTVILNHGLGVLGVERSRVGVVYFSDRTGIFRLVRTP